VSSSAARRKAAGEETAEETEEAPAPLVHEADPAFERLLDEEEAIAAATREQHETPTFRPGDAD